MPAGGTPGCTADTDCPGPGTACSGPVCLSDGTRTIEDAPPAAPCAEDGGTVCDGEGQCVECLDNMQCASQKCGPEHQCLPPSCDDLLANGDETDIDCGGLACPPCSAGDACSTDADCASKICQVSACAAPSCTDGVQNGDEPSKDCGGSCPLAWRTARRSVPGGCSTISTVDFQIGCLASAVEMHSARHFG